MRGFSEINPSCDAVPNVTTLLKLRQLLEQNDLCAMIFARINAHLEESGALRRETPYRMRQSSLRPPSALSNGRLRNAQLDLIKKGNKWKFDL